MNVDDERPLSAEEFRNSIKDLETRLIERIESARSEILTLEEFADRVKVGIRHVFRLKKDQQLPGLVHVGTSPRIDFQEFLQRSREEHAPGIGRRPKDKRKQGEATAGRETP